MTDDITFIPSKNLGEKHLRKTVRYIENTAKATFTFQQWFRSSTLVNISIIDISSKGACINSKKPLSINTKITLNIKLNNGYKDTIKAKVIGIYKNKNYGISFDSSQHELMDQIIIKDNQFSISS